MAEPGIGIFARIRRRLRPRTAVSNAPSGAALARARTIAFVCVAPAEADGQDWIAQARARGAEVDVLPLFQPYRDASGRIVSFVFAPPRESYDAIVVQHRLALFEHSWSYAFLDRLNGLLAPRGALLVPRGINPARQIPAARLKALFGTAPRPAGGRHVALAKRAGGLRRPPEAQLSTLDAYWALMERMIHARFDPARAGTLKALGAGGPERPPPEQHGDPVELLKRQAYRVCNVRIKAAMVQYIAGLHFPGRRDLHLADLGAGAGLNSLELLLNPSGVEKLTLVETNREHHWEIATMVDWLGSRAEGRVSLATAPGEIYRGAPADIVLVTGVFAILDPGQREAFARSAWDNVAPGGILIVLENMRAEDPRKGGRYNDTRLAPAGIDAMLGRFGALRYFPGDAMKELPPGAAGNATVFRVVRKEK